MNKRGRDYIQMLKGACTEKVLRNVIFADDKERGDIFQYFCEERYNTYYNNSSLTLEEFMKSVKCAMKSRFGYGYNVFRENSPNMYLTAQEIKDCLVLLNEMYPPIYRKG